jgi:hypothetical protein
MASVTDLSSLHFKWDRSSKPLSKPTYSNGPPRRVGMENIKPTDALIVGMYQQFGDQVGENTAAVRALCARGR